MAAYQSLGQFISTFADPTVAGFRITENGLKPCAKVTTSVETSSEIKDIPDFTQIQAEQENTEDVASENQMYV